MIEGSGARSIPLTDGSGSGSWRPKNTWIRIRNTGNNRGLTYKSAVPGRGRGLPREEQRIIQTRRPTWGQRTEKQDLPYLLPVLLYLLPVLLYLLPVLPYLLPVNKWGPCSSNSQIYVRFSPEHNTNWRRGTNVKICTTFYFGSNPLWKTKKCYIENKRVVCILRYRTKAKY